MAVNNSLSSVIPLIFTMGLKALRHNCVMPRLVNTDFGKEVMEKGQVINVPLPSVINTNAVVPAAYAPDPGNLAPTTAPIPLNNWQEAPFVLNEKELAQIIDGIVPIQVSAAAEAMASYINSTIFACYAGVYGFTGTAGTTPFATTADATNARKILGQQLAPTANRRFVLDPNAEANALSLPAFQYYMNSGNTDVIKEGEIGRKFGFDFFMDQQVPTQVAGTLTGTVTANGVTAGVPNGNYIGGTGTISIATGASSSFAPNVGDIITFSGDTQTYAVVSGAALGASTNGIFTISPAKVVTTAGGETVTLKASHVVNLAFHRDAFAFASRPLQKTDLLADPDESYMIPDPVSGVTMRLTYRREFHRTRLAFDVLWGVGLIRPQLATRVAG